MEKLVINVLDAIKKLVDAEGTWTEKKEAVLAYKDTSLEEFLAWFIPDEEC